MKFSEIIGQEEVKERLRKSYHDGRIAHALMFLGPEGSGNLALAIAFAQFISCPQKSETDSCGSCPTCRKFQSNQFADLYYSFPYFSTPDKDISDHYSDKWRSMLSEGYYFDIDHWRNSLSSESKQLIFSVKEAGSIVRKLSLTSYEGGYKFMLIWMADLMKVDTANKLLKIVEEPPERTIFLFVANSIDAMLPTILSRVQSVQVPKLSDSDIEGALGEEGLAKEQAEAIAHYADGNWWKALQLARSKDPNELYSAQFVDWMRACYSRDVGKIVRWSDAMHQTTREEQKDFLVYALGQIRQNLMLNFVGDSLVRMNESEKNFSSKFAPFINDLNAIDLMNELTEAHRDVSRNAYSKMVFTDLSLKLHHLLRRKPVS